MPELPDVVPGEPVESDWGNDVRDRITQRFADAAARSASLPFPQAGAVTWLDDPGRLEVYDGTDWVDLIDSAGNATINGAMNVARVQLTNDPGIIQDAGGNDRFAIFDDDGVIEVKGSDSVTRISIRDDYATAVDATSRTARDILVGTTVPDNAWGKDGDIFIRFDAP